jgi:hypothetical protein
MILGPTLALLALAPVQVPLDDPDRLDAWSEDLMHLVESIEEMHPDPFHGVSREEFEAAIDRAFERMPELDDAGVTVELMRLVALTSLVGRDGHSGVSAPSFHLLPLHLYRFDDGWFVVGSTEAGPPVGARLIAIDGVPIDEVCERVAPLLTRDNDTNLLSKLANTLPQAEVLHAVGVTADPSTARVGFRVGEGEAQEVELGAQTPGAYGSWNQVPRFVLPARADVLWLRRAAGPWWLDVLEEERALYVRYDAVQANDGQGLALPDFGREIVETFRDRELERVIVDVRANGGGNNTTFGPLIEALAGDEELNARGRLFCLIGRGTFSAAGNFVAAMDRDTNAILVGEPTGGGPNQYGDARNVALPNHGDVIVRISTRYHVFVEPDVPELLTNEPELSVPLLAADWLEGRDPVLRTALEHGR